VQSGQLTTMTALGIGIVSGLSLLAEPLSRLLFPAAYSTEAGRLIPWIAVATFVISIKQFIFDNSLHATQRNWLHLVAMIAPVIVSIGCGILLVRGFGLPGAATNYLIVAIVATLSSAIVSFRVFAFAIPWRDLAKVVVSALLAAATAWAATSRYNLGIVAILSTAALIFSAVYGALLTVSGFSLRRLIETPWAPLGRRAQADSTSSNIAR